MLSGSGLVMMWRVLLCDVGSSRTERTCAVIAETEQDGPCHEMRLVSGSQAQLKIPTARNDLGNTIEHILIGLMGGYTEDSQSS